MSVETRTFTVKSEPDMDIIDITSQVSEAVSNSKIENGIITIFVPGSTASISTIEFEPNLERDFRQAMERLIPSDIKYAHHETWGDENGKSHIRATLMGPGITVPFKDQKLMLGTWQQIVLIDYDVPARQREIICQILGD